MPPHPHSTLTLPRLPLTLHLALQVCGWIAAVLAPRLASGTGSGEALSCALYSGVLPMVETTAEEATEVTEARTNVRWY